MGTGHTEYVLRSRPAVRAFVLAALACVIGALLLVVGLLKHWHIAVVVLGVVALVGGVALMVAAAYASVRFRVKVVLDERGYSVTGVDAPRTGEWSDVTKVTQSDDGMHVTIYHGSVRRTHVLCPLGPRDPQLAALVSDLTSRLDRAKGYGQQRQSSTSR